MRFIVGMVSLTFIGLTLQLNIIPKEALNCPAFSYKACPDVMCPLSKCV